VPDEKEPRLLTEAEAYAVAAAEVKRETAALGTEIDRLKLENQQIANERDTIVAKETAANERATAAEQALADYKAEIQRETELAELRTSRMATLKERASRMPDDFFTNAERAERVARMSAEEFEAFASDLAAASQVEVAAGPPKETAMRNTNEAKGKFDFSQLFQRPAAPVKA
jgi:predicted  nucleic acid-binding Zn-ribbon protein